MKDKRYKLSKKMGLHCVYTNAIFAIPQVLKYMSGLAKVETSGNQYCLPV